jgi:hypothetical protein
MGFSMRKLEGQIDPRLASETARRRLVGEAGPRVPTTVVLPGSQA